MKVDAPLNPRPGAVDSPCIPLIVIRLYCPDGFAVNKVYIGKQMGWVFTIGCSLFSL